MSLKVHYDPDSDVLYIAKQGEEEETVEIQPGVNLELNKEREIIGIELLNASKIFKEIIEPLRVKAEVG
jgi:uncharacterized protein YuzE